jgi:predicted amidohydrolase YtcJ
MEEPASLAATVSVPGFTDHHAHLLRSAAGVRFPPGSAAVRDFHLRVAAQGSTPMDVLDPLLRVPNLTDKLLAGLAAAATRGLVEITEMGMRGWGYLDALTAAQEKGPLPVRVRVYLASGLAKESGAAEIDARRADCGPWLRLDGVKFYADGWLGPRTCALGRPFDDGAADGVLFMQAGTLARRVEPLAARGWRIATHAIGDRAVATVLDAYELAWGGDRAAQAAAAPRIEHASVQSSEIIARMAESGTVACLQPSFAVTDAEQVRQALDPEHRDAAYPWAALAAAGARMLAGSDYPIEEIEPLVGLARLVRGRADRAGFLTAESAPDGSRLGAAAAFALLTNAAAGETLLSADPRAVPDTDIDRIQVHGTKPVPFARS